jgi:hypothetical protein
MSYERYFMPAIIAATCIFLLMVLLSLPGCAAPERCDATPYPAGCRMQTDVPPRLEPQCDAGCKA